MIEINIVKFLISLVKNEVISILTVITVLCSTVEALDKTISWRTEDDQEKKTRNYTLENRHDRSTSKTDWNDWDQHSVSGYTPRCCIPEFFTGEILFLVPGPQVPRDRTWGDFFILSFASTAEEVGLHDCASRRLLSSSLTQRHCNLKYFINLTRLERQLKKHGHWCRRIESEIRWQSDYSDRRI